MTELNGKKGGLQGVPQGGVLLGGRQMTLSVSPNDYKLLTVLAQTNGAGQTQMAEFILAQGINVGWGQLVMSRVFHVLAAWSTYARF